MITSNKKLGIEISPEANRVLESAALQKRQLLKLQRYGLKNFIQDLIEEKAKELIEAERANA